MIKRLSNLLINIRYAFLYKINILRELFFRQGHMDSNLSVTFKEPVANLHKCHANGYRIYLVSFW